MDDADAGAQRVRWAERGVTHPHGVSHRALLARNCSRSRSLAKGRLHVTQQLAWRAVSTAA